MLVGLLYVVLAAQMLIGLERPWLPARVRRDRLSARATQMRQQRGLAFLRRVERFTRPRQLWISDAILTGMVAVAVLLLGVVLFSPLPFFHTIPALTAMIPGFGLINREAVFRVGGFVLFVGAVALAMLGAEKLVALRQWIIERMQ